MRKIIALAAAVLLLSGCAGMEVREEGTGPVQVPDSPIAAPDPSPPPVSPTVEEDTPPEIAEALLPPQPRGVDEKILSSPPPTPEAKSPAGGDQGKFVALNFDNADITVVIQTIAELIDLNYILAPGVQGRVTIQTSEKLPVSDLFAVLEEILEVNSLTAVKSGNFYKIVPVNQAWQKVLETVVDEAEEVPPGGRVLTKVVRLKYMSPSEVIKVLNPLKSPGGLYLAHDSTRLLFLTDSANKINELMKIVSILDVDTFAQIQVDLHPVKYAGVAELAKELTQVVNMFISRAGRGRSLFRIIPVVQINALMIISGEPGLAGSIRSWIAKLDQPATEVTDRIFVYPLAHATAEDLAAVLVQVFKTDGRTTTQPSRRARTVPAAPPRTRSTATARSRTPLQNVEAIGGATSSPVTIVADKATNSRIIQTATWYYPVVEETIQKLDLMPKQVLIEVLIAEISLDDENQFGIQWALRGQGSADVFGESHSFDTVAQTVVPAGDLTGVTVPGTGFSFLVTEANRLTAVLNAYDKASKLNILSAPHIMATDNKEAKIDIGAEVPILRTRTTEAAGSTDGFGSTVTNDIEYRSTGVILTVTPHINKGRYVTLDIRQEVSEAQTNTLGGTDSPIIRKRMAETTMVVKDGQTLVIGGLIQETRNKSREGLPLLSRIPLLGYLFGATITKFAKTELVLLITPRVIADPEEGDQLTRSVQDRAVTLKKGIQQFNQTGKPNDSQEE